MSNEKKNPKLRKWENKYKAEMRRTNPKQMEISV